MRTISSSHPAASAAACRLAGDADELAAHFAIRRQVFVQQQRLFEGSDRDEHDERAGTLHAVGLFDGAVVGAVRLYPLDGDGLWRGDRLAVLPEARVRHVGALLVMFAVATAGELGGERMIARVQLLNVRFFERLGWHADGSPEPYVGVMHQAMAIALGP
jgi:putative N-acetyltransferase (TIGR04045 family)